MFIFIFIGHPIDFQFFFQPYFKKNRKLRNGKRSILNRHRPFFMVLLKFRWVKPGEITNLNLRQIGQN
ncbi:MAG: hypothetical protein CSB24_04430 [Deltaproteobacteria bacterium]|nr:MAG: hypothetical protein CSB24_04430 [Deltaproteobacteria bacterium]